MSSHDCTRSESKALEDCTAWLPKSLLFPTHSTLEAASLTVSNTTRSSDSLLNDIERSFHEMDPQTIVVTSQPSERDSDSPPISKLPSEILVRIFALVITPEPWNTEKCGEWHQRTVYNLAEVSEDWHRVIHATPSLWRCIYIDHCTKANDLAVHLKNLKDHNFSLHYHRGYNHYLRHPDERPPVTLVIDDLLKLLEAGSRMESLDICAFTDVIDSIVPLLVRHRSVLETLKIGNGCLRRIGLRNRIRLLPSNILGDKATKLCHLELDKNYTIPWDSPVFFPSTSLTTLVLGKEPLLPSVADSFSLACRVFEVISNMPNLQHLDLGFPLRASTQECTNITNGPPAELQHLKYLKLSGSALSLTSIIQNTRMGDVNLMTKVELDILPSEDDGGGIFAALRRAVGLDMADGVHLPHIKKMEIVLKDGYDGDNLIFRCWNRNHDNTAWMTFQFHEMESLDLASYPFDVHSFEKPTSPSAIWDLSELRSVYVDAQLSPEVWAMLGTLPELAEVKETSYAPKRFFDALHIPEDPPEGSIIPFPKLKSLILETETLSIELVDIHLPEDEEDWLNWIGFIDRWLRDAVVESFKSRMERFEGLRLESLLMKHRPEDWRVNINMDGSPLERDGVSRGMLEEVALKVELD